MLLTDTLTQGYVLIFIRPIKNVVLVMPFYYVLKCVWFCGILVLTFKKAIYIFFWFCFCMINQMIHDCRLVNKLITVLLPVWRYNSFLSYFVKIFRYIFMI